MFSNHSLLLEFLFWSIEQLIPLVKFILWSSCKKCAQNYPKKPSLKWFFKCLLKYISENGDKQAASNIFKTNLSCVSSGNGMFEGVFNLRVFALSVMANGMWFFPSLHFTWGGQGFLIIKTVFDPVILIGHLERLYVEAYWPYHYYCCCYFAEKVPFYQIVRNSVFLIPQLSFCVFRFI